MKAIDHEKRQKGRDDEDGTDRSKPTRRRFGSRACRGGVRSPGQAATRPWLSSGVAQVRLVWLSPAFLMFFDDLIRSNVTGEAQAAHLGFGLAMRIQAFGFGTHGRDMCAIHRPTLEALFDYTFLLC